MRRDRYGGPDVLRLETVDDPVPERTEIVIRVHAVSLNRSDWETLTGKPAYVRVSWPGLRRPKRHGLGSDVSGVVTAVGEDVTRFSVGDHVFGDLLYDAPQCLAEAVAVAQEAPLATKPEGLSDIDAAALPQAGALALQALTDVHPVGSGDRVLIVGGGGGAGSFAIQIARHFGATVDGVDHTTKLEFMRSLGADAVFDHTRDDFTTSEKRYDRIIDLVGRRSLRSVRRVLAEDGTYLMVGGSVPRLVGAVAVGSLVSKTSDQTMKVVAAKPTRDRLDTLARLTISGTIRPAIDAEYDLAETADALGRLGAGGVQGKLVITV